MVVGYNPTIDQSCIESFEFIIFLFPNEANTVAFNGYKEEKISENKSKRFSTRVKIDLYEVCEYYNF